MTTLVVTTAFPPYAVGATITDPAAITAILASDNARNVVQANVGNTPGISTPSVSGLIAGGTSIVSGSYYNGPPSGLTYSLDGGSSVAVSSPTIAAGVYSFAIATPAAGAHTLVVTGTGGNTATSGVVSFTTAIGSGGGTTYTGAAPIGVSGGVISLLQSGATAGQVLQWSGSAWVPTTVTTSGGVTITGTAPIAVNAGAVSIQQGGATTGQALVWNGSAWAPATISSGTIPAATGALLGGSGTAGTASAITVGAGLSLTSGTLSATNYALPVATGSVLGGVKAGTGVTIAGDGTISAAAGTTYTGAGFIGISGSAISLAQNGATSGQVPTWNGSAWIPATPTTPITPVIIDGSTIVASTGSPYQMAAADRFVVVNKTTGAATKILLPTSPALGVEYKVKDGKFDAGTNNITLALASGTIEGASTFVMNANQDAITLVAQSATVWWVT